MKTVFRFLCLALCLCLIPLCALGATEEMTAYEVRGIPYFIWNSWIGPEVQDIYTYFYKSESNPMSGMVMTMEYEMPAGDYTEELIRSGLKIAADSMGQSMGSDLATEDLDMNGRPGLYFSGRMYDMVNMTGYMTMVDNYCIAFVIADATSSVDGLRAMLMEIIGYTGAN